MSMKLKIVKDNNPIMRKKSLPVELPLSNKDKETLDAMTEYLKRSQDEEYAKKALNYMKKAANQPLTDRKICLDYYNRADRIFSDDFEDYENISVTNIFIIGAQVELARYYYHDKDISEAKKWLERARKNGLSKHEYESLKKNMR